MIRKIIKEKFKHGDFVYTYYRFLDKFHSEPKSWRELMEFTDYVSTDSTINRLISDSVKQEK